MSQKKPKGPLRKFVRETQLIASAGAVLLVVYALAESSLAAAMVSSEAPAGHSPVLGLLLVHGPFIALAAGIAFGTRMLVDLHPWRLGLGSALFAKLALLVLSWMTGSFEDGGLAAGIALELGAGLVAGLLAGLAAQYAASRVAARTAQAPVPGAPGPDLGEQLRQVQAAARAEAPAAPAPAADGSLPPEPDKP